MANGKLSPELNRLLIIRGLCRAVLPAAVLWGIVDWYRIRPIYGLIFGALTLNYIITFALVWVAPGKLNGPWRIRPWQTFVLLGNALILPLVFHDHFGVLPWGFMGFQLLMIASLVIATKILLYLQSRSPFPPAFHLQSVGSTAHGPLQQAQDEAASRFKAT